MRNTQSGAIHEPDEMDEEDAESTSLVQFVPDGMIDLQVKTAKAYPRSVSRFRKDCEALATLDEETAGECMYALPRGGKTIEGPSARFAEIVLHTWGNSRAEALVIEEGATHVKAQGTFYDLERNVAVRKIVARRITDKGGRRFNDDMIGTTGNAACSIALRNAVFAGVPKAIWKSIYQKARQASLGKGGTLTQTRQTLLDYFGKLGVTPEKVFAFLGVQGLEDMGEDQVITMRGVANAIKDGEASVEDTFSPRATGAANSGTPDLNSRIKEKAAQPVDTRTQEEIDLEEDRRIAAEDAKKGGKSRSDARD